MINCMLIYGNGYDGYDMQCLRRDMVERMKKPAGAEISTERGVTVSMWRFLSDLFN
mgnify:CR=1 FL=1